MAIILEQSVKKHACAHTHTHTHKNTWAHAHKHMCTISVQPTDPKSSRSNSRMWNEP